MKSNNHECLISYLKKNYPNYEYEINIIYKLKNIRNRISYDGIFVEKKFDIDFEMVKKISELKDE